MIWGSKVQYVLERSRQCPKVVEKYSRNCALYITSCPMKCSIIKLERGSIQAHGSREGNEYERNFVPCEIWQFPKTGDPKIDTNIL